MRIWQILLSMAILCISTNFAYADLIIGHEISPSEIWTSDSGNVPNLSQVTLTIMGEGVPQKVPAEVVLAIDSSENMINSDPLSARLLIAKSFVETMNSSTDKVGVVSFDDDIDFAQNLTNDTQMVINEIEQIDSEGSTNLDTGLDASIDLLTRDDNESDADVFRTILLLSDGSGNYTFSGDNGSQVDRAVEEGVKIYAIGVGVNNSTDEEKLRDMATVTGGEYYSSLENDTLETIYEEISVMDVAGEDVTVEYTFTKGLNIIDYSIEPDSVEPDGSLAVLSWNLGTMSMGEIREISFNASIAEPGRVYLDGSADYLRYDGTHYYLTFGRKQIDAREFRSGISAQITDVPHDFISYFPILAADIIRDPANYELKERTEHHVVWRSRSNGDWFFVFGDGRLIVASEYEFSLDDDSNDGRKYGRKDRLADEMKRTINILNNVPNTPFLSSRDVESMLYHAVYYTSDSRLYRVVGCTFDQDFEWLLRVPDCAVNEAWLTVTGCDYGTWGQRYFIDDDEVCRCGWPCSPTTCCSVDPVDIRSRISTPIPGTHTIRSDGIGEHHIILIEAVTPRTTRIFQLDCDGTTVREVRSSGLNVLAEMIGR